MGFSSIRLVQWNDDCIIVYRSCSQRKSLPLARFHSKETPFKKPQGLSFKTKVFEQAHHPVAGDLSYDDTTRSSVAEDKIGVLLLNLGGPETLNDVQPFLYNLFADPVRISIGFGVVLECWFFAEMWLVCLCCRILYGFLDRFSFSKGL